MKDCLVCGANTQRTCIRVTTDQPYVVRRCARCGAAFTFPRPTPESLAAFYGDDYFEGESEFGYSDYCGDSLAAINASRMWDELQRWAPEVLDVTPRRILDVGSATGDLLSAARETGWPGVGVELSEWAAEVSRQRFGLEVVGDLDEVHRPPGGFGLVTMFHVVEHLPAPAAVLAQVRHQVSDQGSVIIEVPHWRSLGRLVRQSSWSQLRPPEHINFFTRSSITELLCRAGFAAVRVDTPYPHLHDRWRAARGGRRLRAGAGVSAAVAAEWLHLGGYLRVLARPSALPPLPQ